MKINEIKQARNNLEQLQFILPDGSFVPAHFHVTEIGAITRHFIDCGGVERIEKKINFQLWEDVDYDHRLAPGKLLKIIDLAEEKLRLGNFEVEVEYQRETIGKFGIEFDGGHFLLTNTKTDCLAKDNCGIPTKKPKLKMSELSGNSCAPGSGCC